MLIDSIFYSRNLLLTLLNLFSSHNTLQLAALFCLTGDLGPCWVNTSAAAAARLPGAETVNK